MKPVLAAYGGGLLLFLALDYLWLGHLARDFYARQLGDLLRDPPQLGIAALFYLAYVAGIVFFAVLPALREGGVWQAALYGALLGLLAYGTYDITNLATIRGWPWTVSLVDMAWGTAVSATTAAAGYLAARWLG
ncbi:MULTISPECIES: DUF2177 family protein [unclassified Azospirillum]|uniref:DUF2177 family protein n=1 Tax=unclassified Azospirillum TaxID=2630922 RepID=UPI000B64D823|nr:MULTISPECIES: DUF2177 family protein [unclassified Azospirillum]SNS37350.1 Uncharacterized membrane protein [Azospirillum sp. RU38E]SNS55803.1 Uncharacterized membrane protein [Azospirillum sp. RU37A]